MLCCLFWEGWSLSGLWPKLAVLCVRGLPVVKIVHLLIFSERGVLVFYLLFFRLWDNPATFLNLVVQLEGFAVSCPVFLLPGLRWLIFLTVVSIYLWKSPIYKVYSICYVVLKFAPVTCKTLANICVTAIGFKN